MGQTRACELSSGTLLHALALDPSSASIKDWNPLGLSVSHLKTGVTDAPHGSVFKEERSQDQEEELDA